MTPSLESCDVTKNLRSISIINMSTKMGLSFIRLYIICKFLLLSVVNR